MNRSTALCTALAVAMLLTAGCNHGSGLVLPETPLTGAAANESGSRTVLWGYCDVYVGLAAQTAVALPNRDVMFAANVVQFLNGNPANLQFKINGTPAGPGYVDVDIDVSIKHPFPGMTQYNGYDVRGIFIGSGSKLMKYNADLKYAAKGAGDQLMYDFNLTNDGKVWGNPDGYTRWWNPAEFTTPGVLGYTPGMYATPAYTGTATLNPYKYFADDLGVGSDLTTFLKSTTKHGVFSAGSTNTRNYYLRFPTPSPGVKYNYAVVANWIAGDVHPANAHEAVNVSCSVTPDIYYVNSSDKGGNLILDVDVFDWESQLSGGVMSDYVIKIESTVLSSVYTATALDMTPTGGDANYSTYHLDIPADNITSTGGQEFWVIIEEQDDNYTNDFGVTNLAGTDKLAAFFRYDLYVSPTPYNKAPVCDIKTTPSMPYEYWSPCSVEFDASASYDPDGDPLTYEWDFDGDGSFGDPYDSGTDQKPTKVYNESFTGEVTLRLTDDKGKQSTCSVDVALTLHQAKGILLATTPEPPPTDGTKMTIPYDIAVNPVDGTLSILWADDYAYWTTPTPAHWGAQNLSVWKYSPSDWYDPSKGTKHISCPTTLINANAKGSNGFIDVAPNGCTSVVWVWYYNAFPSPDCRAQWRPFLANGSPAMGVSYFGYYSQEAAAFGNSGTYANNLIAFHSYNSSGNSYNYFRRSVPDYTSWISHYWGGASGSGYSTVFGPYVKGIEIDSDNNSLWVLMMGNATYPKAYCSKFTLSASSFAYAGAYFGVGNAVDNDTGFYNPKDLTRTATNKLLALDVHAGTDAIGCIKTFVPSASGGAGSGSHVDLPGVTFPLRLDCSDWSHSDWGNIAFLLYYDVTGSQRNYRLSIIFPNELP